MADIENTPQRGVMEKTRQKTAKPSMYKVFLLNDDYTTMEFVVEVHVHRNGKGLAGVYTREIAETEIARVHAVARENGYPLKCDMEKE